MSYNVPLSSDFHFTKQRTPQHLTATSGMCSRCTAECRSLCEIGLSCVRGAEATYPIDVGSSQFGSEKLYPVDFSHFNINGRVFGAQGAPADSDLTNITSASLETGIGREHPLALAMPVLLPAIIKLNWEDYFAGAALMGVPAVVGEGAIDKDGEATFDRQGRVTGSPFLARVVGCFKQYDRGVGDLVVQANQDDIEAGVLEYCISALKVTTVEIKFGQAAKGVQACSFLPSLESAIEHKKKGHFVYPDPLDPVVAENFKKGIGPRFKHMGKLPMHTEETLVPYVKQLRELGAKRVFFKMGGFDPEDIEQLIRLASACGVDLVTFDGAGGGTGNSPTKMMNEWGRPAAQLECVVVEVMNRLRETVHPLPDICIAGGFVTEDQVFKGLALGAPYVKLVGICRPAMAAAMRGKSIGEQIAAGAVPDQLKQYGDAVTDIFSGYRELRAHYGSEADRLPPGAVGVYSYLERVGFGLKLLMALNRKFQVGLISRRDILPLSRDAVALLNGEWFY